MIRCAQCGRELGGQGTQDRVASMAGSIMGDEYIESYFLCRECGVYTVEHYHDRFLG
jgi:DNA-directed RNA polymerase subunit RPC12/RpoP